MPLRRAVRGRPAKSDVEEQELPNAPEVQPQREVTNVEFRKAIRILSQVVTNEVGQEKRTRQGEANTSRIRWAAMLIGDMDISRLMVYVQQVEEEKLRDKEEFKNKRAKTGNESGQQKSNANRSSFQEKQKGLAPSSASVHTPKNKCEYNSQNFRAKPVYSQGSMA
uniref:Gag-pol polyprotein n=1 Tax=Solanum tuberosum TaxID=4113 RepID=M1DJV5_SOLTU